MPAQTPPTASRFGPSLLTFVLAAVCLLAAAAGAAPQGPPPYPMPGSLVDIGGYRLHLYCTGPEAPVPGPTVILESGLGGTVYDWSRVQPEVAGFARVCSYDRAGHGWSERSPRPRTAAYMAEELAALLDAAALPRPYLLAGHSLGGFTVRGYAHRHPGRVAGLLLLDASHEDQFERLAVNKAIAPTAGRSFVIGNHYQIPAGLPEQVRPVVQALVLLPDSVRTLYGELGGMHQSALEARAWHALPEVPVTVLAHDSAANARNARALEKARRWMGLQTEMASRARYGRFRLVRDSGHFIQLDQPAVVTAALRELYEQTAARR